MIRVENFSPTEANIYLNKLLDREVIPPRRSISHQSFYSHGYSPISVPIFFLILFSNIISSINIINSIRIIGKFVNAIKEETRRILIDRFFLEPDRKYRLSLELFFEILDSNWNCKLF